jgi:hypothetical protein
LNKAVQITSINKPEKRSVVWWGMASNGDKNYQWFYWPRKWLHLHEQDEENPRSWSNVDPPPNAKRAVLKAIRAAKVS